MFSNVSIIFVLKYFSVICANTLLLLGRKADDGWKITFITPLKNQSRGGGGPRGFIIAIVIQ